MTLVLKFVKEYYKQARSMMNVQIKEFTKVHVCSMKSYLC